MISNKKRFWNQARYSPLVFSRHAFCLSMDRPYLSVLYSDKIHKYRIIFGYFGYGKFYTKKNQTWMTIVRIVDEYAIIFFKHAILPRLTEFAYNVTTG